MDCLRFPGRLRSCLCVSWLIWLLVLVQSSEEHETTSLLVCHCFGRYMVSPRILRETWFICAEIINSVKKALLIAFSQLLRRVVLICFHSFVETLVCHICVQDHNLFFDGRCFQDPAHFNRFVLDPKPLGTVFSNFWPVPRFVSALIGTPWSDDDDNKDNTPKGFFGVSLSFSVGFFLPPCMTGFVPGSNLIWSWPSWSLSHSSPSRPSLLLRIVVFEEKKMCAHCFRRYWDIQQPYL